MANVAASVEDAVLIALPATPLGRLVRLERTLDGDAPRAQHRLDLVHAAIRSTVVDLAGLDRTDLDVAILARDRRGRPPRRIGRGHLRTALGKVLDEPARLRALRCSKSRQLDLAAHLCPSGMDGEARMRSGRVDPGPGPDRILHVGYA